MKSNMRYFYSIFAGVIGIWAIKHLFFVINNKKELDLSLNDFALVGSISGFYLSNLIFSNSFKYSLVGTFIGLFYGILYVKCIKYFVNKKIKKAKKLGISLS